MEPETIRATVAQDCIFILLGIIYSRAKLVSVAIDLDDVTVGVKG
jgi:hypothetical protein